MRQRIFEIVNFVNMVSLFFCYFYTDSIPIQTHCTTYCSAVAASSWSIMLHPQCCLLQVYKPLRTFIALVGLEIWTNGDLISVTPPAGANLDAFMKWRNSELVTRIKHDNAHLISGIDFEGPTVGLAFIGTLCSGHSVGVVQDHSDAAIAVGATLSHEMGHNLGMDHDDSSGCLCSDDSCIMAAHLGNQHDWGRGRFWPKQVRLWEVCLTSLKLKTGHSSARRFQLVLRMTLLKTVKPTKITTCPEDVFAVNGLPCDGGQGYCYNGQCPQRPKQCVKMYGSGAKEAKQGCYNYNTRGVYYGFCKRPSNNQFIPCQQEDVLCGKLFCEGGNDNPNYGRMVAIGTCKAAFFSDTTGDQGLVETGTKCGDGKVCNHKSECQCEPGWTLPNCDSVDTAFSGTGKSHLLQSTD
uniref:ADAM metallopeptidase domain 28 n=1 Tax=Pundamilia nyererei TaxID=303518 RepID=A0A3B4FCT5_9CICH